jgi:hypothetical protein
MVKKIVILNIGLISVICFNHRELNLSNLSSFINTEYLVESNIHLVDDNYEEDNLSIENGKDYKQALKQNLSSLLRLCTISGISKSIWQPPE